MTTTTNSTSAAASPAQKSESRDILPFKATEKTLANGLKIIVVPTGMRSVISSPPLP